MFSPSCTEAQRVMRRRMLALVPMAWQRLKGALLRLSPAPYNSVACRSAAACVQVPRLCRSFISALPRTMLHPHVLPVQPQHATQKAIQKLHSRNVGHLGASLQQRCHLQSEAARRPRSLPPAMMCDEMQ